MEYPRRHGQGRDRVWGEGREGGMAGGGGYGGGEEGRGGGGGQGGGGRGGKLGVPERDGGVEYQIGEREEVPERGGEGGSQCACTRAGGKKIWLVAERGHGQGGRERDQKRLRWLEMHVSLPLPGCIVRRDIRPRRLCMF